MSLSRAAPWGPIDLTLVQCRSLMRDAGRGARIETSAGWADGVEIRRVENIVYVPEYGLPIVDGFCPEELIGYPAHLDLRLGRDASSGTRPPVRMLEADAIQWRDEEVFILGNAFSHVFGHWLEELLKVVVLEGNGFSGHYAIPSWYSANYLDSLDMLNIPDDRILRIDEPTGFREGVVTSNLILFNISQFPRIAAQLREQLTAAVGDRQGRSERLWAIRGSAANGRRLVNEDEVHDCARRHGFEIVDYALLSFKDQVALDRGARVLAGPHGSAMLHSAFLPDRSDVIELFSPFYVNPSLAFCLSFAHRHTQLVGINNPRFPYQYDQDIYINMEQLELALATL